MTTNIKWHRFGAGGLISDDERFVIKKDWATGCYEVFDKNTKGYTYEGKRLGFVSTQRRCKEIVDMYITTGRAPWAI